MSLPVQARLVQPLLVSDDTSAGSTDNPVSASASPIAANTTSSKSTTIITTTQTVTNCELDSCNPTVVTLTTRVPNKHTHTT